MKTSHLFQLLLLSAVWGASFLLIRVAGQNFPPLWVALLRCIVGSALLFSVLFAGGRRLPPRRLLPWLIPVALFNNAIPFTLFAWGEQTIPSSMAAVVNATTPIWTLLISMAVQRQHVTPRMIVGVLLSFAGVVLVVSAHTDAQDSARAKTGFALGVIMVVLASLCYAIATVAAKAKLQGIDPIGLATAQLSLASLMLLPLAFGGPHPTPVRGPAIAAVAILGLAGSGLAYLLYYNLLAHVSATHVVAVTYLTPIWGLFWGWTAQERIGWTALAGVSVVIGGLLLLNWNPKTNPNPARLST